MTTRRKVELVNDSDQDSEVEITSSSNSGQTKRPRPDSSTSSQTKKARLDGYFAVPLPKRPSPYGVSDPLNDKDSLFVAFAAQCENQHQANKLREYVTQMAVTEYREDPPSHVMQGTRILVPRTGNADAFETKTFSMDDGESKGGRTIVEALAAANAVDVSVCVARWFGGSMLGPRRFDDIANCATAALYRLRDDEELMDVREHLESRDNEIQELLKSLSDIQGKAVPSPAVQDYESLDLAKAKRLLAARTMRISNIQTQIKKAREAEDEELPALPGSSKGI
jgi:putative IMPACT (imprinted ancient) family translation regulator